jgi:uncharacterized protein (DUF58 family)
VDLPEPRRSPEADPPGTPGLPEPQSVESWTGLREAAESWTATRALGRAIWIVGVLLLVGSLFGRPDLVAIAAPFAVGAALALRRRPTAEPQVELELPAEPPAEGSDVTVVIRVANPSPHPFDLVVARVAAPRWVPLDRADRPHATDLAADQMAEVVLRGPTLRWGRHAVGPAHAYAVAADGLLLAAPMLTPTGHLRVFPVPATFRADQSIPRSAALVGLHRSRRPGEGGELAGVRRYTAGDRLRRVDWRVTLRTGEPHVAATWSDRDATVLLVLDVARDAGISGGVHGSASVVDTTVRAAAAIAEHYLRHGDRVGLVELSGDFRHLPAKHGRRHLQSTLDWLLHVGSAPIGADSQEPPGDAGFGDFVLDPHRFPASALAIVLTPLLDADSGQVMATLARAGRLVVAVDTLGDLADRTIIGTQWTALAQRLWRLEREHLIGQLWEVGVPVTGWAGAGSLDQVLRDLTRLAAAPRLGTR